MFISEKNGAVIGGHDPAFLDRESKAFAIDVEKLGEQIASIKHERSLLATKSGKAYTTSVKLFSAKLDDLDALVAAVQRKGEALVEAKTRYSDFQNAELFSTLEKIRGLLSYGIASGQAGGPAAQFLHSVLGDLKNAKTAEERKKHVATAMLALEHSKI